MKYPKINTLCKREEKTKNLIFGDYSKPEFENIKLWHVEEKIDGMNIRIHFIRKEESLEGKSCQISFGGRTDAAQIPCHLLSYLMSHFTQELMDDAFPNPCDIILFGEGYGPKIQSPAGENYRLNPGFILFDAYINEWWLNREGLKEVATRLNISMPPFLAIMTESEIIEFVKSKPSSFCSLHAQPIEGVICRSHPLMLFRDGDPIMWKLKCKEFSNEL